jgi:flagellar biogenesis protein FliO
MNPDMNLGEVDSFQRSTVDGTLQQAGKDNMNELVNLLVVIGAIILLAWIVNSLVGKRS